VAVLFTKVSDDLHHGGVIIYDKYASHPVWGGSGRKKLVRGFYTFSLLLAFSAKEKPKKG
jgi:hypothetical protein